MDTQPFRPAKPIELVNVQLTKSEWNAIKMFRNLKFGSITLIRLDSNGAFRVEIKTSMVMNPDMEIPDQKSV
jgi:hypothetical protein